MGLSISSVEPAYYHKKTIPSVSSIVKNLKSIDEDFEWYPTTDEIIGTVKKSIAKEFTRINEVEPYSLLDCGAGDGRVLNKLSKGDMYAIEKSKNLLGLLGKDISIVGTEFHETTFIDKEVDVIFCNPPYSEYGEWTSKIIREANSKHVYLVIPERWENNTDINLALNAREVKANILGSFDFSNADRKARARVDILHIQLKVKRSYDNSLKTDPFDLWFDANFPKQDKVENSTKSVNREEKIKNQVAKGQNLIEVLVELYNEEMTTLNDNFKAVSKLNGAILFELDVNIDAIKKALKQRIKGLKNQYWKEFFSHYSVINKKLTEGSRQKMLNTLYEHTQVEFTASNAYAITGWCIKNANSYFNSQLVNAMEKMVDNCNITAYKSNERLFKSEDWRYGYLESIDRYSLDLRCIMTNQGGIKCSASHYRFEYPNGLHSTATTSINDLIIIANNLGFSCSETAGSMLDWSENKSQNIPTDDGQTLMNVKAFQNGNIHIKFNQNLIKKMNVEFGRLKGWLKDKREAVDELGITELEANEFFYSNMQLSGKPDLKLLQ